MIRSNFHTHTAYCDGENTVDEMVRAALDKGMRALGFSGHSTTLYDLSYCMRPENVPRYVADIRAAQARYGAQIELYLGVEDDIHGERPDFPRDFTIGSAHNVVAGGQYFCVDHRADVLEEAARVAFGGDIYRLTAAYFETMAQMQDVTHCDLVGHFDLVTKFNEGGRMFDESDPRYLRPALEAVEHLCSRGAAFEINTGAMVRGYRTAPYPSRPLLQAVHDFGGAIVLSSDSHSAGSLGAYFREAAELAERCGFTTCRVLTRRGWQEVPLDGDAF